MDYDEETDEFEFYGVDDLFSSTDSMVEGFIQKNMKPYTAEQCGLDKRASYSPIFVDHDAIAVTKQSDRVFQYYGGGEYISKENRKELGSYVFYLNQDESRVERCINRALGLEEKKE